MFPNWAKNILFLLVYMISGLILVIIIEGLMSGTDLNPVNTVIEHVIVHFRTPLLTTILVWTTNLGNPFALGAVAIVLAVFLILKKDSYDAILFLISMIVSVIALTVLKNIFQIQRPVTDIYVAEGWSFPSGHATVATTFFFMIIYIYLGRLKTILSKTILITGSILGVLLICFTRLYLGAHWMLDIIGGIALGLSSISFTVLMFSVFVGEKKGIRY